MSIFYKISHRQGSLSGVLFAYAWMSCVFAAAQPAEQEYPGFRLSPADTSAIMGLIHTAMDVRRNNTDSAILLLRTALQQSRLAVYRGGAVHALHQLGGAYADKGQYEQALAYYRHALSYCADSESRSYIATLYNSIANIYQIKGDYTTALRYYYRAVAFSEKIPSTIPVAGIYNNMGAVLIETKQYERALYYFSQAETYARREKQNEMLASALINKGIIHMLQEEWDRGLRCYKEALALAEQHNILKTQYTALSNIGEYYQSRDMPRRAIPYLLRALSLRGAVNPWYYNGVVIVTGHTYLKLKEYRLARAYLLQALEEAERLHLTQDMVRAHKLLADLYAQTGDFRNAFRHHETYALLQDSLTSEQTMKSIHRMEIRYQSAEKDKRLIGNQLLIAHQKNRLREKNIWIGGIAAGAVLLAVLLASLYRSNQQRQRLQAEKIRNLQQKQELIRFRSMITGEEKERTRIARELHDGIVGQIAAAKLNFSAIQKRHPQMLRSADYDEALQQLDNTAQELRETAHNLMPETLFRDGLGEAVHSYCDRIGRHLSFPLDCQIFGSIPPLEKSFGLSVYRIAQELVQNIIKHAHATAALLQINCQDGLLSLTAEDNGKGFPAQMQGKGLGLANVRERVRTANGHLEISTGTEGTTIYIEFDIRHLTIQSA